MNSFAWLLSFYNLTIVCAIYRMFYINKIRLKYCYRLYRFYFKFNTVYVIGSQLLRKKGFPNMKVVQYDSALSPQNLHFTIRFRYLATLTTLSASLVSTLLSAVTSYLPTDSTSPSCCLSFLVERPPSARAADWQPRRHSWLLSTRAPCWRPCRRPS